MNEYRTQKGPRSLEIECLLPTGIQGFILSNCFEIARGNINKSQKRGGLRGTYLSIREQFRKANEKHELAVVADSDCVTESSPSLSLVGHRCCCFKRSRRRTGITISRNLGSKQRRLNLLPCGGGTVVELSQNLHTLPLSSWRQM